MTPIWILFYGGVGISIGEYKIRKYIYMVLIMVCIIMRWGTLVTVWKFFRGKINDIRRKFNIDHETADMENTNINCSELRLAEKY